MSGLTPCRHATHPKKLETSAKTRAAQGRNGRGTNGLSARATDLTDLTSARRPDNGEPVRLEAAVEDRLTQFGVVGVGAVDHVDHDGLVRGDRL
jgi:hypothetical protein